MDMVTALVTEFPASWSQEELDSTDTSVVISSCSLAEARLLLDNFLKASIDKVSGGPRVGASQRSTQTWLLLTCVTHRLGQAANL